MNGTGRSGGAIGFKLGSLGKVLFFILFYYDSF